MDKGARAQVGRKSLISLAQMQVVKEIRSGKQQTIVRALREGKSLENPLE